MTKKNFVTLIFGVLGGVMISLGMCMCLLPEWNAFTPGVVCGVLGAAMLLILLAVRRKMDGKQFRIHGKLVGKIAFGVAGALVMGTGMCMIMVWNALIPGIVVGLLGIALLLCLIPLCVGLK